MGTPTYIETLPLPVHVKSALQDAGYFTIEQMEMESPKAISYLPKLGRVGFEELRPFVPAWQEGAES